MIAHLFILAISFNCTINVSFRRCALSFLYPQKLQLYGEKCLCSSVSVYLSVFHFLFSKRAVFPSPTSNRMPSIFSLWFFKMSVILFESLSLLLSTSLACNEWIKDDHNKNNSNQNNNANANSIFQQAKGAATQKVTMTYDITTYIEECYVLSVCLRPAYRVPFDTLHCG